MENQIYRLWDCRDTSKASTLEFFIATTNEIHPYRKVKEMGIVLLNKDLQIDFSLDEKETKSLIEYLKKSLAYIKKYNVDREPEVTLAKSS